MENRIKEQIEEQNEEQNDRHFYKWCEEIGTAEAFNEYRRRYPGGIHFKETTIGLKILKERAEKVAKPRLIRAKKLDAKLTLRQYLFPTIFLLIPIAYLIPFTFEHASAGLLILFAMQMIYGIIV